MRSDRDVPYSDVVPHALSAIAYRHFGDVRAGNAPRRYGTRVLLVSACLRRVPNADMARHFHNLRKPCTSVSRGWRSSRMTLIAHGTHAELIALGISEHHEWIPGFRAVAHVARAETAHAIAFLFAIVHRAVDV